MQTDLLPSAVFTAQQVREMDRRAIQEHGIAGYELMCRAGEKLFAHIQNNYPKVQSLGIVCGAGNNGGDGYVLARLALKQHWQVALMSAIEPRQLVGEAKQAYEDWLACGGIVTIFQGHLPSGEILVDALLGTGLTREVSGIYKEIIQQLNAQIKPVVAVDIPSGLHADTGQPLGVAVNAALTISFIGMKIGLLTGSARDYTGNIIFESLAIPEGIYQQIPSSIYCLPTSYVKKALPARKKSTHKGSYGHVLLIGGAPSMSGAIRLAGESALRAGAGLVTVATHTEHANWLNLTRPELMVKAVSTPEVLDEVWGRMKAIGIGPGLGQSEWAMDLLAKSLEISLPKVLDADALNLLALQHQVREDWILTPHPAEAARLLKCSTQQIEQNRLAAVQQLQRHYGGVVVLKGAGTLIASMDRVAVCPLGNPGMATAGMGDVLTGIITALLAQGFSLQSAAEIGVYLHAQAADIAALSGQRGLIASDVIKQIRTVVNP